MLVSRIKIANHSRIADLDVEVRGHAVIVGANDVGKTSILRLADLLLGATTGQLYQRLGLADLADPSADLVVEAVLTSFTDEERRLFPREISIDPGDRSESLLVRLTAAADPDDAEAVAIRRWFPEAGHDRAPSREQVAAFAWRFLPATRGTAAAALDGERSALHALLQAIDLGAETADLAGLLEGFNAKLAVSERITDLRSKVASHCPWPCPALSPRRTSLRTAADPQEDVLGGVSMFFERDGRHVPVAEQSDGLRQLMSMTLFDLAEGTANVVAVDEPELHLHPASQRTVAELFRSGGNQKILVTHSPYIVQPFEPSQVIAVSRTAPATRSRPGSSPPWRRSARAGGHRGSWRPWPRATRSWWKASRTGSSSRRRPGSRASAWTGSARSCSTSTAPRISRTSTGSSARTASASRSSAWSTRRRSSYGTAPSAASPKRCSARRCGRRSRP